MHVRKTFGRKDLQFFSKVIPLAPSYMFWPMSWNLEKKCFGVDFWYWYDVVAIILICWWITHMMFANNWIYENQKFKIPLDNDSNNDIMIKLVFLWFKVGVITIQLREACKHVYLDQKKFQNAKVSSQATYKTMWKLGRASGCGYHLF